MTLMFKRLLPISISFVLGFFCIQNTYSQKFQQSILGGVNLAFEEPEKFNPGVTIEYQFEISLSKNFSLGISPYFNIANYSSIISFSAGLAFPLFQKK